MVLFIYYTRLGQVSVRHTSIYMCRIRLDPHAMSHWCFDERDELTFPQPVLICNGFSCDITNLLKQSFHRTFPKQCLTQGKLIEDSVPPFYTESVCDRVPGRNMWTAGERQVVQLIGQNLLLRWVTAMAITSLCYGPSILSSYWCQKLTFHRYIDTDCNYSCLFYH